MSIRIQSVLALAAVGAGIAGAPGVHATNGYQLIGVGAYQKSLGGAVTANPGSAMTAITNPAGYAVIPNRADFSMEAFMPFRNTDFKQADLTGTGQGGDDVDSDVTLYGVPALGWKADVADNLWFGGGIYGTSGLGVDYEQTVAADLTSIGQPQDLLWDGYSSIAFWQIAPALAWKATETLSLGASLNIDYQSVSFQQRFDAPDGPGGTRPGDFVFNLNKNAQTFGAGAAFGLLWQATDRLTLGGAYKTKQWFQDSEYNLGQGDIFFGGQFTGGPDVSYPGGKYKLELDYPQQASVGAAFALTPRWKVSGDIKWIEWSDTLDTLTVKSPDPNFPDVVLDTGWDDQWVFALGLAWAVTDKANLRAGFNYGEAPIEDEDVDNNLILPAVVQTHYTIGGDVQLGRNWDLGFHAMYAPEETLRSPTTGVEISMYQYSVGFNLGYQF